MFELPEDGTGSHLTDDLFSGSLPATDCSACGRLVGRREHRVKVFLSWRDSPDDLCTECWGTICQWAQRFALQQGMLDL